ncbi:helicase HerA-like domain-containing protein [Sphingosinicella terrae]|uniref:helicase HerA-like domain-containing protein n=1 Tax=Sphingosinicella terrae TaxID=2172047 RepID=UPI000E0DA0DB|nr:helicase HerA-like domain-containing protein [Sphingosinicella terrae]
MDEQSLFVGQGGLGPARLRLDHANRHGLIAGATGTGKTVTLQGLAEGFSRAGVPVFVADVKGDLAGLAMPGDPGQKAHEAFTRRAAEIGLGDYAYGDVPVMFWDLLGERGHPMRTTVSEMGPFLLARLLGLNETQQGVLNIAFTLADEQGLLLLNLDDLQSMLAFCAEQAPALSARYGNIAKASVGAIQRQLLAFAAQGADRFFGEPALAIEDFLVSDESGRGCVSILAADRLIERPMLYATFLLWLLSELFETLPEVGDTDKPRFVFFFDEAHLLFDDAPDALREKVEQVVRLIRSKGVGVYFITQNPGDIPDAVAGQLGHRFLHALRAYTPADQRAIRAAAETFRPNPALDVATAITELRTGEALVSLLDADGAPTPADRVLVRPPASRAGPLSDKERAVLVSLSPVGDRYDRTLDRESAHELLQARAAKAAATTEAARAAKAEEKARRDAARAERERQRDAPLHEQMARQLGRSVQRQLTNRIAGQIVRGLFGGLFRGR